MMKIDCQVINTQMVHIMKDAIPDHLARTRGATKPERGRAAIITRIKCSLRATREMHPGERTTEPSTLSHLMASPRVILKWTERENSLVRTNKNAKHKLSLLIIIFWHLFSFQRQLQKSLFKEGNYKKLFK